MIAPEDKPDTCTSCHFVTDKLVFYKTRRLDREWPDKWLCGLCAHTDAGTAEDFPEFHCDHHDMKTICYVGNVLLAEIRKLRP